MSRGLKHAFPLLAIGAGILLSPMVAQAQAAPGVGILVMAHGGQPAWDQAVVEAVTPLKQRVPTALAMGMADPGTLQAALDSLQAQGARSVAVVRLFLSGESFLHDTEYYFGLREDAPAMPMALMMSHGGGGDAHQHHAPTIAPLKRTARILMEPRGLSEAPLTAAIVADRARSVSTDPARESVIVIAHGMGDEGENQRVLDNMEPALEALRQQGFRAVQGATLREDWPEARKLAEAQIRDWVAARQGEGERVIVVPYRLFGFGGYAEVLEGLRHTPADGLLPHPLIAEWITESAGEMFCAQGIANPLSSCAAPAGR